MENTESLSMQNIRLPIDSEDGDFIMVEGREYPIDEKYCIDDKGKESCIYIIETESYGVLEVHGKHVQSIL